jgi:hypothetical protein
MAKDLAYYLNRWSLDANAFATEALGIGSCICKCEPKCKLDIQQVEILRGLTKLVIAKNKKMFNIELTEEEIELNKKLGISVKSGKGVGKTALLAIGILWFMTCFLYPKILVTAPKRDLLRDNLWGELSKWIRHSIDCYGERNSIVAQMYDLQSDKMVLKKDWLDINKNKEDGGILFNKNGGTSKEWLCLARTANINAGEDTIKQTLQGYHAPYMMLASDEASGVHNSVFEPLETTLTDPVNFLFLIFNPNKNHGYAIDTHYKNKKHWLTYTINAENSSLVSRDHIVRLRELYINSPNLYRVNVLGEPPLSEEDALIPFEWIQEAKDRWSYENEGLKKKDSDGDEYRIFGVDVGRGGDKSVIVYRVGNRVEAIYENGSNNTMEIVSWVCKHLNNLNPSTICIDRIGIGAGVYDRLRELGYSGLFGINVSMNAYSRDKFVMLRDELFWRMRNAFEDGIISIPDDNELELELVTLKSEFLSGKIKIVSKKDMAKSPNKADALSLTYYFQNSTLRSRESYNNIDKDNDYDYDRKTRYRKILNSNSFMGV